MVIKEKIVRNGQRQQICMQQLNKNAIITVSNRSTILHNRVSRRVLEINESRQTCRATRARQRKTELLPDAVVSLSLSSSSEKVAVLGVSFSRDSFPLASASLGVFPSAWKQFAPPGRDWIDRRPHLA